jgi:ABC-2 type transport system permease protein
MADDWIPLPSRSAFERAMAEDRAKGLDGHNPADVRRKELEQQYLTRYGVSSVAELPLDFGGIVMQADEEYGNQVWDVHYGRLQGIQGRQVQVLQLFSFVNPYQALRSLSMALAGTDLFHDIDFQRQAEEHRRWLIASLNREHAHGGGHLARGAWRTQPEFFRSLLAFRYEPRPARWALAHRWPEAVALLLWLLLAALLVQSAGRTVPVVRS